MVINMPWLIILMERRFEDLKENMDSRFEQVYRRLDQVDKRFDQIDKRLALMDGRLAFRMSIWVAVIVAALSAILGCGAGHGHL